VLIVEDILDTGRSMTFLLRQFASRGAKSLRLAVLVDKQERREVPVCAAFTGFALPGGFIVGYGLDYANIRAFVQRCKIHMLLGYCM